MANQSITVDLDRDWTPEELRKLGASEAFIKAYFQPYDGRHSIVSELDGGFGGRKLEEEGADFDPSIGGGFFESLWKDEPRGHSGNPYGADGNNKKILALAGVSPYRQ